MVGNMVPVKIFYTIVNQIIKVFKNKT